MLAKQVAQDLHLSSDGPDFENLEETNKDTPTIGDPQLSAGTAQTESWAKLLGPPIPPNQTTPTAPPEKDWDTEKTANPIQEEVEDAGQPPTQPTIPVAKLVMSNST